MKRHVKMGDTSRIRRKLSDYFAPHKNLSTEMKMLLFHMLTYGPVLFTHFIYSQFTLIKATLTSTMNAHKDDLELEFMDLE